MSIRVFSQPLFPLAIVSVVLIVAFTVVRSLLVPESFGEYGHYRADAVKEIASLDVIYAGYQVCSECHDDVLELKQESNHRGVSCEACHGPGTDHVEDPDEFKPAVPRGRGHCPLCHGYSPSRPSGFPQIITELHNPGEACMACHDPHNPVLPRGPEECSACHRDIVNVKIVSHHAGLPCRTCHAVSEGHLTDPKGVSAEKPVRNEQCGQCHDASIEVPRGIPTVDMETHAERYMCWDCHYPHFPETRR